MHKYLNAGASADIRLPDGQLVLVKLNSYLFYDLDRDQAASYIIDNGAKIDYVFDDGTTLLHEAVQSDNKLTVKALLRNGINKNKKSTAGLTALFYAHSVEMFKLLVDNDVGNIKYIDNDGNSLLHLKSIPINIDVIEYLADKIDVNIKNKAGDTAFSNIAVMSSRFGFENLKPLLEAGAMINEKNGSGFQAIHYGAIQDPKMFFWLVEQGADINGVTTERRFTNLFLAARNNNIEVVKYLLSEHVDVNYINQQGETALNTAIENKHQEVIKLLEDNGAIATSEQEIKRIKKENLQSKIDALSSYQRLKRAIKNNDINEIKEFYLKALNDSTSSFDKFDIAERIMRNSSLDAFKFAVDNGLDVSTQSSDGFSLIHLAVFYKKINIVEFLIDRGIDVNAKSQDGISVYDMTRNSSRKIMELLLKANMNLPDNSDTNMAEEALYYRNPEMVEYFVEHGYPFPNDVIKDDDFIIGIIKEQDIQTIRYLSEKGLNHERKLSAFLDDVTLLHAAVILNSETMTSFFLEKGGDPNAKSSSGSTPTAAAVERNNQKIIKAIYEHGGDPNEIVGSGVFALSILSEALDSGHIETAKLLINKGADVNFISQKDKNTPLHFAARLGDVSLLKLIMKHGGNVQHLNEDRHAPLDEAIIAGHQDAEVYLRKMEAKYPAKIRD